MSRARGRGCAHICRNERETVLADRTTWKLIIIIISVCQSLFCAENVQLFHFQMERWAAAVVAVCRWLLNVGYVVPCSQKPFRRRWQTFVRAKTYFAPIVDALCQVVYFVRVKLITKTIPEEAKPFFVLSRLSSLECSSGLWCKAKTKNSILLLNWMLLLVDVDAAAIIVVEIHGILYCRTLHLFVDSSEMISFASNLISFWKADWGQSLCMRWPWKLSSCYTRIVRVCGGCVVCASVWVRVGFICASQTEE